MGVGGYLSIWSSVFCAFSVLWAKKGAEEAIDKHFRGEKLTGADLAAIAAPPTLLFAAYKLWPRD